MVCRVRIAFGLLLTVRQSLALRQKVITLLLESGINALGNVVQTLFLLGITVVLGNQETQKDDIEDNLEDSMGVGCDADQFLLREIIASHVVLVELVVEDDVEYEVKRQDQEHDAEEADYLLVQVAVPLLVFVHQVQEEDEEEHVAGEDEKTQDRLEPN